MNRQVLVDRAGQVIEGKSELNEISPKYFATWHAPILAGRDFDDRDTLTSPKVTIVNESFARKYLAGANPVGATLRVKSESKETGLFQIVGLAKGAKLYDLREEYLPTMFMPVTQKEHPHSIPSFALRPHLRILKSIVRQINCGIDMDFTPFDRMVEVSLQRDRLMAHLFRILWTAGCARGVKK